MVYLICGIFIHIIFDACMHDIFSWYIRIILFLIRGILGSFVHQVHVERGSGRFIPNKCYSEIVYSRITQRDKVEQSVM